MKIIAFEQHRYRLPLRAAWVTSAGSFSCREGYLLRIATDDHRYGYGDCAPFAGGGIETLDAAAAMFASGAIELSGMSVADALSKLSDPAYFHTPAVRCAVETALLDLLAQAANMPLASFLHGGILGNECSVNATLGSLMNVSEQAIVASCDAGFSVLKFKVGTAAVGHELARLHAIATLLPVGTLLRLDANCAWSEADAEHFLRGCIDLPIEMIEEPLADPRVEVLRRLQAVCAFPLALDESLPDFVSDAFFAKPPVRRLVLKPTRLGGLLPALNLARRAVSAGLQCTVTSSVESACGVLAAAHMAVALDNGLAHGLATSSWLLRDTGVAPAINGSRLKLASNPGLGFDVKRARIFS